MDYDPGTTVSVTMHDGSQLRLRKLSADYDPTDRIGAVKTLLEAHDKGEVITGVFYLDTKKPNFYDLLHMTESPLATLPQDVVRPPREALYEVMESLR